MDFSIKAFDTKTAVGTLRAGCIAVGVFENKKLPAITQAFAQNGTIGAALKSGDLSGKPGSTLLLREVEGIAAERVLLVGLGSADTLNDKNFSTAANAALRVLSSLGTHDAILALPFDAVKSAIPAGPSAMRSLAAREQGYRFDTMKSKQEPAAGRRQEARPAGGGGRRRDRADRAGASRGHRQRHGPDQRPGQPVGNVCTPTYLANTAKKLAKEFGFGVEVLDRKQMQALKMGSFLSVTNGSEEPPKFIVLKHMGGKAKEAPMVLVGKGITFDSGGISLKPGAGMDEMKYDMCGAASVLGTLRAIAEMKLKLNVIGVIPSCENMPSGRATKPGDIVTSMSGQTIEVLNTDAEGRLILCDALTYVERFKPAAVVDIATLTGACIIALGHHNSGLFTRARRAARRAGRGTAGRRQGKRRHRLAHADRGCLPGAAQVQFRRHGQHRRPGGRQRAPPPVSWSASPANTPGRTWTSPARPGRAAPPRAPPAVRCPCWRSS